MLFTAFADKLESAVLEFLQLAGRKHLIDGLVEKPVVHGKSRVGVSEIKLDGTPRSGFELP